MRGRRHALGVGLLLACASATPASAAAHGRPPYVERVAFDPSDPDRVVLQFSFGLLVTEDRGASWRWVCAAAFGADPTWEEPDVVVTHDGAAVLGTFTTAVRADRSLCAFQRPGGSVHDTAVIDLAVAPDARTVWAITSRGGGEPDRVQRSDDAGMSWTAVAEIDALVRTIALAPSDPDRVYLTAMVPATTTAPRRALLYRSEDAASFEAIELTIEEAEQAPVLAGVDPTDADRVFLRMQRRDDEREPERLLLSTDAGGSFSTAFALRRMRGFTISDDGRTVWAGSAAGGGVWVARDGGLSFERVNDLDVRCLAARGAELWMCVDQLTSGFAVARSTDGGASYEVLLRLHEVEALPPCGPCDATQLVCPYWLDDLRIDFAQYLGLDAGADAILPIDADTPTECLDAGARDAGAMDAGREGGAPAGCGCRSARGSRSARGRAGGAPLLLSCLAWLARRRGR